MLELNGEDEPADLAIRLEIEPTEEGQREIGIAWAIDMASRLIEAGAPGIHLYTFNQHETVLSVLSGLGLLPAATTDSPIETTIEHKESV
jgi:methylenetetrahydrofolate reductase (NADPH)